ncbi:M1 family metallopeptidase [Chitinophaga vietnamensis]|uniref:M1 family metallopeptidase n=1 Tax=Chitinophaga vietnamensis TaxID=2593957 RepID=UPI001178A27C|nr:M1 family metallopeptidase [Chitinophaga vietnamensis]
MKKYLHITLLLLLAGMAVSAQELYMPRNIRNAYTKGTRDTSGRPGANYWQNKGRYDIQLAVNPPSRTIQGQETIRYINNSPDTLRYLLIRMLTNLHKYEAPRSGYHDKDFLTAGVTIDTMIINGKGVRFNNDVGTVGPVKLPQALLSKDSIQLQIKWHYDVSVQSGREGMIDSTTFYLAYAYPRVSVYDDYNGWDDIPHTDRTEFYSDFNDYNVTVSVPKNFVVWGTGNLLNPDEVLQPAIAARLKASFTADSTQHIATFAEMRDGKVTAQQATNNWKFSATHIADVTYGVSNHYVWDAASTVVDNTTGRRASIQAAYNDTASDFHHSVRFSHYALNWFSHHWPGVAYPFPVMTAFQGFADMEYPMMVNDGSVGDDLIFAQLVQDHEIAHTYFPFYMGINETRYAFMDEGWATTFEYLIGIAEKGKEQADRFYKAFRVRHYISDPSTEEDMPIISMSNQVSGMSYGSNAYGKPSLAYLALKDMLGDERFKKCLHAYMNNWHGKHPIPWDFFYSFNTAAGENLNWYWDSWFFSHHYIDLALYNVQASTKIAGLTINNVGGFPIPFDVVLTYADGSTDTIHQTPAVWKKNPRQLKLSIPLKGTLTAVKLDGGLFMDYTPKDNNWSR